jgi:uncharacterized OB-fold protein
MKRIVLKCPKCGQVQSYKNWFIWVLNTPFHWFGKRYTKCRGCGEYSFMKKERVAKWTATPYFDEQYGICYTCSNCGSDTIGTPNYCPNCGAEMTVDKI